MLTLVVRRPHFHNMRPSQHQNHRAIAPNNPLKPLHPLDLQTHRLVALLLLSFEIPLHSGESQQHQGLKHPLHLSFLDGRQFFHPAEGVPLSSEGHLIYTTDYIEMNKEYQALLISLMNSERWSLWIVMMLAMKLSWSTSIFRFSAILLNLLPVEFLLSIITPTTWQTYF